MLIYTSFTPGYDAERDDILQWPAKVLMDVKINKICPHEFFEDVVLRDEIIVWVDGNIYLTADNLAEIEAQLKTADIVVMTHPHRNCIYDEAAFCIEHGIGDRSEIERQVAVYRSKRYPENAGLYGCGVIARRHTDRINQLCEEWFWHVVEYSKRDQISFPFVFRGVKIGTIHFESVEIRPHL